MARGVEDVVAGEWNTGASTLSLEVGVSLSPALTFLTGFTFSLHIVAFCVSGSSSSQIQVWQK